MLTNTRHGWCSQPTAPPPGTIAGSGAQLHEPAADRIIQNLTFV
jgi:hypothetical protein